MFASKKDIVKYECHQYERQCAKYDLNVKVKSKDSWRSETVDISLGSTFVFVKEVLDEESIREAYEQIKFCRNVLASRWQNYRIVGCKPDDVQSASVTAEYIVNLEQKAGNWWKLSIDFLEVKDVLDYKNFVNYQTPTVGSETRFSEPTVETSPLDFEQIKAYICAGLVGIGFLWVLIAGQVQQPDKQQNSDVKAPVEQVK